MATATAPRERRLPTTQSADPETPGVGEDGFPTRQAMVNGELVAFSLKPYPEHERPLYWNPIWPGQEMRWRSPFLNELNFQPTIQREAWHFGQFRPRNGWEEHMTRTWMRRILPGCADPDDWKGTDHPKGGQWRCHCSFACGNWAAFEAHRLYLRHEGPMRSENPEKQAAA